MGNFFQQPKELYEPLVSRSDSDSSYEEKKKVCWRSLDGKMEGCWRKTFPSEDEAIFAIKNSMINNNSKVIYWIKDA